MSEAIAFEVEARENAGTGFARALRKAGKTPCIVYGVGQAPVHLSLNTKVFTHAINTVPHLFTHIMELKHGGKTYRTILKDLQLHPVRDTPLHADFLAVTADSKLEVSVPLEFINHTKSNGLERGGVLNVVYHEIEVACSPDNIPEVLIADLTGLEVGDTLHVSQLTLPKGVTLVDESNDFTIATIAAPSALKSEDGAAEGSATPAA